jgi:hypothetical protein
MKKPFIAAGLLGLLALTGCTPDKHITEVKALPFSYPNEDVRDPNLTVDQALDYRKVCDSVKWKVDMTEQHQMFVEYQCDYKNVEHSALVANAILKAKVERGDKANGEDIVHVVHASDIYQWTYGANGSPALSFVTMHLQYSNGTSKDMRAIDATSLMMAAAENEANDYDHIFNVTTGVPIPPMPTAATEAALRQAYADARPRKLSSEELVSLFSPKVVGTSVTQYESLVGKFAGKPVTSNPHDGGTAEQTYKFADCFITVNTGQGKILSVTVPLGGGCPVTDADMPSYLQGKQWDWSKLLVKNVSDLASKTTSDQMVSCVNTLEVTQPACISQRGHLTTTIRGSQADGFIDSAFVTRTDGVEAIRGGITELGRRNNLKEYQVTSAMYNNDPDFMKTVMRVLNDNEYPVSTLTLQRGGLSGRNSQAMASTATPPPPPAPQVAQAAQPTPAAPVTPQVVNSAVAALTGASQPQGQPVANTTVHSGDVGPDGWPKMTPCIQKLQDKFTTDQQKQNADTSTSLEQMQEWADVCKSLGQ